jgi:hypothetical protein
MPLSIKIRREKGDRKLSKYDKRFAIINEAINKLVEYAKEDQFLYGEDSVEGRKAKRNEEELCKIRSHALFLQMEVNAELRKLRQDKSE